jgi:hypothetical protein
MTTQLPPRERPDAEAQRQDESPEVLFEEARRRRRRRWIAGSVLVSAAIIAGALFLGIGGGGGGGSAGKVHGQPFGSGSGAGSGHVAASKPFAGARSTRGFYTGPGSECKLVPRSRYLPAWSGCVSETVAHVFGNGRKDLILSYSRLSHVSLRGLPPRSLNGAQDKRMYAAEQAMLRIVSPDGHMITAPIAYKTTASAKTPAQVVNAAVAALISVAHVSGEPGKGDLSADRPTLKRHRRSRVHRFPRSAGVPPASFSDIEETAEREQTSNASPAAHHGSSSAATNSYRSSMSPSTDAGRRPPRPTHGSGPGS